MARSGRKRPAAVALPKLPAPVLVPIPTTWKENGRTFDAVQPTVERLMQAGLSPSMTTKGRKLQVTADDQIGKAGLIRAHTAPLQWLASRNMLDDDRERNGLLREAGERYYRHWFDGGLKGIGAQNLDRVFGGQSDPAYMTPTSEYAAQHRHEFREARDRMGSWLAKVADAVICDELTLADAGSFVGDYASAKTRSAIALTMLKAGLTTLGEHFGILNVRPRKIRAWSD